MMLVRLYVSMGCVVALGAPPTFPEEYSAVIMMRMPYIPLQMPLRIVTSTETQKLDYYDGLQVVTSNKVGTWQYVFNNSERICSFSPQSSGPTQGLRDSLGDSFKPNAFLPDLSKYTREEDENIGGIMCHKYTLGTPHGNIHTMDDHFTFYWDPVLEKPVRWHQHARLIPFGSHTDEYILDFLSFQPGRPADHELALPKMCAEQPTKAHMSLGLEAFLKQNAQNARVVEELNQKHAGLATFKANRFTGLSKEQVMAFRGGRNKGSSRIRRKVEHEKFVRVYQPVGADDFPKDFDWRIQRPGVVSPVKDQAFCGSCWTYGAMEPIESAVALMNKRELVSLPEQFMLDCTWTNGTGDSGQNSGCDGGDSDIGALEIVRKFGGIVPTAAAYGSYLSVNGFCKDIRSMEVGAKLTGWVDLKYRDENSIMEALVSRGPLSVSIQVPDDMLYYDSGVFTSSSCKFNESQIDHSVVLVGYGTQLADAQKGTPSQDYWTIRNSWSTYWGDQGYIKIARGDNDCCIACEAGYPELAPAATSSLIV